MKIINDAGLRSNTFQSGIKDESKLIQPSNRNPGFDWIV